jgi:hypothetical protein
MARSVATAEGGISLQLWRFLLMMRRLLLLMRRLLLMLMLSASA